MKKILFAFFLSFSLLHVNTKVDAQLTTQSYKTITAADTVTHPNVGSNVTGIQATYKETSGTSAGKFYLEGSCDGLGWQHIDSSKSLGDNALYQTIHVAVTNTSFTTYRVRCSNTSSATGTLWFTILRRPDEIR